MLSGLRALSAGVAGRPNITVTVLGSPEGPAAPRVTNAETARAQRSKLTRDIEAVDSDVREMGKAEDEVIGQLAARAKMLERTLRERDDELKEARPRLETLEVELAAAKEESANLAQLNAKLKGHLSGLRHNLLSAEDITP